MTESYQTIPTLLINFRETFWSHEITATNHYFVHHPIENASDKFRGDKPIWDSKSQRPQIPDRQVLSEISRDLSNFERKIKNKT